MIDVLELAYRNGRTAYQCGRPITAVPLGAMREDERNSWRDGYREARDEADVFEDQEL